MKKIINDPNKYLSEMLEGIYIAHQNQLTYVMMIRNVWLPKQKSREGGNRNRWRKRTSAFVSGICR